MIESADLMKIADRIESQAWMASRGGQTRVLRKLAQEVRIIASSPADQPPVCPDHREAQHRDNKPPWCDSCGWRHGEPARRYGNGRVVA